MSVLAGFYGFICVRFRVVADKSLHAEYAEHPHERLRDGGVVLSHQVREVLSANRRERKYIRILDLNLNARTSTYISNQYQI